MPEIVEVRVICEWLKHHAFDKGLIGQKLVAIDVADDKLLSLIDAPFRPKALKDIVTHGKRIAFEFEKSDALLSVHLRMTGEFCVNAPKKHRALFRFENANLYFKDTRRFATLSWQNKENFSEGLGQDALKLDDVLLLNITSKRGLKSLLLDQSIVAGLGNIWADEVLFDAGLCPMRTFDTLDDTQKMRLGKSIRSVLNRALDVMRPNIRKAHHGISWVKQKGQKAMAEGALIHGALFCPKCQAALLPIKIAQRSTWFCKRCQD